MTEDTKKGPAEACPKCGSTHVLWIVYGEPPSELGERARRGEIVLGGCVIYGDDPAFECQGCKARFGVIVTVEGDPDQKKHNDAVRLKAAKGSGNA